MSGRWMIQKVYKKLLAQHGQQEWWPADSKFEVMVGAILTQNTSWTNVERVIENLKGESMLCAESIVSIKHIALAKLLKSSGYFNIKAKRLQSFCKWFLKKGGYKRLRYWPTKILREELLSVYGIGYETADDILLYAFERPIFIIDAYTRRIFSRLGFIEGNEHYDELRLKFESNLLINVKLYSEYHALIVHHGKEICKSKPNCSICCLNSICKFS